MFLFWYMNRKELLARARQWRQVLVLLNDDTKSVKDICAKHPWLLDDDDTPQPPPQKTEKKPSGILNAQVLNLLTAETGIASHDAWWNVFWLISKSEHDNEVRDDAFASDVKGLSVFGWASALSYDWRERGVTIGVYGATTGYNGDDRGDAFQLFDVYTALGGDGALLKKMAMGCTRDKTKCDALIAKIRTLEDDPRWILAQFKGLLASGGYLKKTVQAFKKIGIDAPSPLAIATVMDASLNQGWDGPDGGCTHLEKLGVAGDENATLAKYNAWRRRVAGTNDYNSPPINGRNRADQFETLRLANQFSLDGPSAVTAISKAISWEMK